MNDIYELQDAIRKSQGAEPVHVLSQPVHEEFQGRTVWDGIVEVFELIGHKTSHRAYAWTHLTGDPNSPKRHVTVLHYGPINSPENAVRAFIIQEYRDAQAAKTQEA